MDAQARLKSRQQNNRNGGQRSKWDFQIRSKNSHFLKWPYDFISMFKTDVEVHYCMLYLRRRPFFANGCPLPYSETQASPSGNCTLWTKGPALNVWCVSHNCQKIATSVLFSFLAGLSRFSSRINIIIDVFNVCTEKDSFISYCSSDVTNIAH